MNKYPDHRTVRSVLVVRNLLRQARWQRAVNLLAFFVVCLIIGLGLWFFWPQIEGLWNQFLALRSQVNFTVNP